MQLLEALRFLLGEDTVVKAEHLRVATETDHEKGMNRGRSVCFLQALGTQGGSNMCWDMSLANEGWLIRIHATGRKRRFHPLHSSMPLSVQELDGCRVTKRFLIAEGRPSDVTQDQWVQENMTEDNTQWSGYTFLKLKETEGSDDDDGSYEKIDP